MGEVLKLAGTSATDEKKGETTIKIDFSVKGGPKDVPGVFKEGKISFPDGNVWPKEAGVSGVYLDPQHKEGYRVVRATSPSTVQIVLQDDPKAEVLKLAGTSAT